MSRITRLEICSKNNSSHRFSLTKAYTHTATLYNSTGGNVKTQTDKRLKTCTACHYKQKIFFPNGLTHGVGRRGPLQSVFCILHFNIDVLLTQLTNIYSRTMDKLYQEFNSM
jgi:hypothetical protein